MNISSRAAEEGSLSEKIKVVGAYLSWAWMAFCSVRTALSPVQVLAFSTSFISASFWRFVVTAVFFRCSSTPPCQAQSWTDSESAR